MRKFEKVLSVLLIFLGIMSINYYFGLVAIGGVIAFSEFWILLGITFLITAVFYLLHERIKLKLSKKFKLVLISVFTIFIASFILVEGIILYYGSKEELNKPDYIMVLGAGLRYDKISTSLQLRLNSTLELANQLKDVPIIVSGGQGSDEAMTEAKAMKDFLIENNIPENRIITEDKSTNTYENFKFTKDKLKELYNVENPTVTIITNNFHMYRSQLLAEKLGFSTHCYSASSHPYLSLNFHVREFLAVVKVWILGK